MPPPLTSVSHRSAYGGGQAPGIPRVSGDPGVAARLLRTAADLCRSLAAPLTAALLSMPLAACQPIVEEPAPTPAVNRPPRIVEGQAIPSLTLLRTSAVGCSAIGFSAGLVEDADIDQVLQERWLIDYDAEDPNPSLGTTVTLQRIPNAPASATDPVPAYVVTPQRLQALRLGESLTIDLLVSDGFDSVQAGKLDPFKVLEGRSLDRKTWVILADSSCTTGGLQ